MNYPTSRQYLQLTAASLVAFVLLACSTIGLTPAQSIDQQAAYATGQLTGVVVAAAVSRENGQIDDKEKAAIRSVALQTKEILDGARIAFSAGDLRTAEARLQLGMSLLTALQARLNAPDQRKLP